MKLFKCEECGLLIGEDLGVCPKCNSKEKTIIEENLNCLIDNEDFVDMASFNFENKGYGVFIANGSEYYIPGAEHIERIDEVNKFEDDYEAAIQAEKDGIKLINNTPFIPNRVYIDTPENRDIIEKALEKYPEYKQWGENKANNITIKEIISANRLKDSSSNIIDFQIHVETDNEDIEKTFPHISVWIKDEDINNLDCIALCSRELGNIDYVFSEKDKYIIKNIINNYLIRVGFNTI